jgi:hypothetical protein
MSGNVWIWGGGAVIVLAVLFALDGLRQRQRRAREKRMTPEEREIARREAKASQSVFRRGR